MTITYTEFVAIRRAGINPAELREDGTFAAACCKDNSAAELLAALRSRAANPVDCAARQLTPTQRRAGIRAALAGCAFAYGTEHGLF